ncbi:S41 family peptidase [Pseudoalteromonas ulvae]|uniref:Tail specific protease domain-containing protein n=1 Tax=Pseudoalteromonas ulvae TaxID=107327 RepID=A0A244CQW9_PSEDV|nr:S41 family peptidase [Pseudoalteromonas ulvae]OUL58020.1 hypothetical protein B1199_06585 [Pseudoalteromonas ulvae]
MALNIGKGLILATLTCVTTLSYGENSTISPALSEEQQLEVIHTLTQHIQERSIVPGAGKRVAEQLIKHYDGYKYLGFDQPSDFADKLSDDIQALLKDSSFVVHANDNKPEILARTTDSASNKISRVNDEIALIELDLHSTHAQIDTLFSQVKDADVLVFDLRNSYSPAVITSDSLQYVASYLFNQPTTLYQLEQPAKQQTKQVRTLDKVAGEKRGEVPVYVLTSAQTGIVAERFSLLLQHLQRAYIVGEPTAGRVNITEDIALDSSLMLTLPTAIFTAGKRSEPQHSDAVPSPMPLQPDLLVTSFLAFSETQPLAEQSAVEYRVLQGRGTPQETFSQNKGAISYSDWRFYGSDCALEYRLSEPMYNANTERYQFAYQLRYYGHGSAKMRYSLGNGIEQMTQQANFADKSDLKSAISRGFKSFEPIKMTQCSVL